MLQVIYGITKKEGELVVDLQVRLEERGEYPAFSVKGLKPVGGKTTNIPAIKNATGRLTCYVEVTRK